MAWLALLRGPASMAAGSVARRGTGTTRGERELKRGKTIATRALWPMEETCVACDVCAATTSTRAQRGPSTHVPRHRLLGGLGHPAQLRCVAIAQHGHHVLPPQHAGVGQRRQVVQLHSGLALTLPEPVAGWRNTRSSAQVSPDITPLKLGECSLQRTFHKH